MPDLNDAMTQEEAAASRADNNWDWDAMSAALSACADRWVPEIFPRGKIVDDKLRVANIGGAPPRKDGSCVIDLKGDKAGFWHDFSTDKGGGPVSTVKEALGLSGAELWRHCSELLERHGASLRASRPSSTGRAEATQKASSSANNLIEAASTWSKTVPLAGTLGETYLRARGITQIPTSDDLRFSDDVVNFKTMRGQDGIVARFRYPDGRESGGIHRIYLKPDGTKDFKKMLGPIDGAVVMLAPPDDKGRLGVGEGIETTAAAMQLYDAPGWAAGSDGGLKKFADWIRANPGAAKALGIRRLLIWADAGKAGVAAAKELEGAACADWIDANVYLPRGGDDFNDDLQKGLAPAEPMDDMVKGLAPAEPMKAGDAQAAEPEILPTQPEVSAAINTLTKESDPGAILTVIEMIASARLDPLWEGPMLSRIKDLTSGQTIPALRAALGLAERRRDGAWEQQVAKQQVATATDWKQQLKLNKDDEPKQTMGNAFTALVNDQAWRGVLGFNEFTGMIMMRAMPPWPEPNFKPRSWTDEDTRMATLWMQKAADLDIPSYIVFEGVATAAERYRFHPVREYFDALKWDNIPRLENWLIYYCGCDPSEYISAIGPRWVISAVARVYQPGCKADCCLILEGDQGIGKSTAFRTLASPEWFTDEIADLGSKDAAMQMRGKLIIELAELDALGKAEVSRQKIYISRTSDRFRPPYGKNMIEVMRQSVFAGSVNDNQYLKDPTGGRRFWGAWCKNIDLEALAHDRDQIWAEAVYRYRQHATWYLETPELVKLAKAEQDARREPDAWQPLISKWLNGQWINGEWIADPKPEATTADILQHALGILDRAKWTRADQMRVGACMKSLGWERKQFWNSGASEWRYVRPNHPNQPN